MDIPDRGNLEREINESDEGTNCYFVSDHDLEESTWLPLDRENGIAGKLEALRGKGKISRISKNIVLISIRFSSLLKIISLISYMEFLLHSFVGNLIILIY